MNIILITPSLPGTRAGNRTTALRMAKFLRRMGHDVTVAERYKKRPFDLMIALHAYKSAAFIDHFRRLYSENPLIVTLTGTDVYRDIHLHPSAQRSIELADRLICLQEAAIEELPPRLRDKAIVIYQSAGPLSRLYPCGVRTFDVCVVANLRDEKDPLRAAAASRLLPSSSRIRVLHFGKALSPAWKEEARLEMLKNPRYEWKGEVPNWKVRQALGRSKLMVLSSKMEGGANVISEAIMSNTPVIASKISGSIGMLGTDYPGYFPVGDTKALANLLEKAEASPAFYASLNDQCKARQHLFLPEREFSAWQNLLAELCPSLIKKMKK